MNAIVRPLEVVAADFAALQKVLDKVLGSELESFQGLSGHMACMRMWMPWWDGCAMFPPRPRMN